MRMSKIEEKLKGVPPKSIVIVDTPLEENQIGLTADFLKFRRNDKGIYVSSNRPTNDLIEKLLVYGFDMKEALEAGRLCVIDLMSKSIGACELKGGIYVSSPSELAATQMAIEKAIERVDGETGRTWLLLDSISTLLVYNTPPALLQFLHFLIGRLRVLQFSGVIFTVGGSGEWDSFNDKAILRHGDQALRERIWIWLRQMTTLGWVCQSRR